MEEPAKRKLAAILCADVVEYSRLMGADESATVQTLTEYRGVFLSYIQRNHGRVVDAKGDAYPRALQWSYSREGAQPIRNKP